MNCPKNKRSVWGQSVWCGGGYWDRMAGALPGQPWIGIRGGFGGESLKVDSKRPEIRSCQGGATVLTPVNKYWERAFPNSMEIVQRSSCCAHGIFAFFAPPQTHEADSRVFVA